MNQESGFIAWLKSVWPRVYRVTNGIFYWLLNFFKNSIRMIINQIRN